ncbi:MAG: MMPL family transporter [Verrucomicrobia bacterium]|nr:MMPL family transporter [Verrucomicrobiota bacterium]
MNLGRESRWLLLVLLVPAVVGLTRLRFNVEVLDLLPGDLPAVQGLKNYQRHFANTRELIITLAGTDAEETELAAGSLAQALSDDPGLSLTVQWEPPWRSQPLETAELLAFAWLNLPPAALDLLVQRLSSNQLEPRLEQLRQTLATSLSPGALGRAGYDPFGLTELPGSAAGGLPNLSEGNELFASPAGTFRVLFVQNRSPLASYRESAHWLEGIRNTVSAWRQSNPSLAAVAVGFTGQPAFMAEIGGGMERDMTRSVVGTLLIIATLFLWVHRRLTPLLWLTALLTLILAGTLGFGGLWFGTLNVVSTGFAAILLGLAVDYGLVLYQEARMRPQATASELQRQLAPSISWAALTTAAAFLALNLSQLPGLAQLGALVTVGILLAAVLMLMLFLAPLLPLPQRERFGAVEPEPPAAGPGPHPMRSPLVWSGALLLGMLIVLTDGLPSLDHGAAALRPRASAAYAALDQIKARMGGPGEPLWLLVKGTNELEVALKLDAAETALKHARSLVTGFTLPTTLWAHPDRQAANRVALASLVDRRAELRQALQNQGFSEEAFALAGRVLDAWSEALTEPGPHWPSNAVSAWVLGRFVSRSPGSLHALGLIYPVNDQPGVFRELNRRLPPDDYQLASWAGLGELVLDRVRGELAWLSWLMLVFVLAALGLAFRRTTEVLLSLVALGFALAGLLAVMRIAGWSWNLMNLMAIPLLLGTSVDYSIHIQLALRRNGGDLRATRRATGHALLLCGVTTITAFSSLAWSSNAGLASLGRICAVGIACAVLTAVFILPAWWKLIHGHSDALPARRSGAGPSRLYSGLIWQIGRGLARHLPEPLLHGLAKWMASLFRILRPGRFRTVVDNLLPAFDHDRTAAEAGARRLFRNFGLKIAHLWAYEAGRDIDHLVGRLEGRDRFFAALESRRGVLLITPHLGNWEFGAPLLARHGIRLMAVTMEEPTRRLTELRRQSRQRWGIETIVIQRDPFAFLEVLRQLEAGAAVALLVDRPPAATAVSVSLFGETMEASLAPAELARASGCILLPVYVLHHASGYHACVLPEIPYDRRGLRQVEARQALAQEIMRAFEPIIRNHPDQWYHFVPIWQTSAGTNTPSPAR